MFLQNKPADLMVQIVLISESVRLQQMLATYGIQSETPRQVEPILIWPPENLSKLGAYLGACSRLGLKGRPKRPHGQLGTSKFYRIGGATVLCYPLLFQGEEFYLSYDMNNVIDDLYVSSEEIIYALKHAKFLLSYCSVWSF